MDNQKRIQELFPMRDFEKNYKAFYEANPDAYYYDKKGKLYRDWDEFCVQYKKTIGRNVYLPQESPTLMNYVLSENDFFMYENQDVDIVMNARYCPPFWHHLSFIKIMYVFQGELLINIGNDKRITLKEGNFVIVPPDLKQSVFSCHDEDIVINVFLRVSTFERAFSTLLLEAGEWASFFWKILYGKDVGSIVLFKCERDDFLEKMLLDMYDEIRRPRKGGNFMLISYVMTFLAHSFLNHEKSITSFWPIQMNSERLSEIILYIRENYDTVTLSELAKKFGKSEGYLCRYIRRETGYSLTQLLKEFRMRQAAVMLRETRCSIEEIMLRIGYTDISYFYKVFKECYKMTPKKYREQEKIILL